ncbi:type II toxin-antitoxin system VapC family toxin [Vibrio furnissii]|uniref:type II toxin-antitoxin system VapC family toxin n=1 Tax=Vibrio furnissii TaxID=29494 RepID=UPI0012AE297F|nr:PIN domain-containing protein [Vibrio furnissii]
MANIINIQRQVVLHHTDRFFVDTNVWFWLTYAASNEIQTDNSPVRYQLERYPEFIEKILDEGASLYHSPLALSELANIIEKTEYETYLLSNDVEVTRKEFRNIEKQRQKVMLEVSNAWQQVTSMSQTLAVTLNAVLADHALQTLKTYCLDAYDAFYVKSMSDYGIINIVTDDRDFHGLDLNMYTANNALVR